MKIQTRIKVITENNKVIKRVGEYRGYIDYWHDLNNRDRLFFSLLPFLNVMWFVILIKNFIFSFFWCEFDNYYYTPEESINNLLTKSYQTREEPKIKKEYINYP